MNRITTALTALMLAVLAFVLYNAHPHYTNCHRTIEGKVCTLSHYTWGK